jgi:hypothetical protein
MSRPIVLFLGSNKGGLSGWSPIQPISELEVTDVDESTASD